MAKVAERFELRKFTEGRTADEWVKVLYDLFRVENDWAQNLKTFWKLGISGTEMSDMGVNEQVFLEEFALIRGKILSERRVARSNSGRSK